MKYLKRYTNNNIISDELSDKYHINHKIVEYAINLGYDSEKKFLDYINRVEIIHDPYLLKGMNEAVERINCAIDRKEKILIFGDYDVDGIGATAILIKYFKSLGVLVDYYLPSRYEDGYGLSYPTVDKMIRLFSPDLIITVDCGISCKNEVEYLQQKGVDVIVTDHHNPPQDIPNCIVIDPKLDEQAYPFSDLCGAGVALKLVTALGGTQDARKYYTIASISTISDMVELKDENRYIVHYGLEHYSTDCPIGIKKLLNLQGISTPNATEISFKLTPKLNASGRIKDAHLSLKLYLTEDEKEANDLCAELFELNEYRKDRCEKIYQEALQSLEETDKILVIKGDWEIGVLGIIATRIMNDYMCPVILCAPDKRTGNIVGSARCPSNYNIYDILQNCSEYLVTFGGHSMAGGISLRYEDFDKFKTFIVDYVAKLSVKPMEKFYDIEISEDELNVEFIKDIYKLEPFGVGNLKPIILLKSDEYSPALMKNHNNHLTLSINNVRGVGFNLGHYYSYLYGLKDIHLCIDPYIEEYKGKKYAKFMLNDISYDQIICKSDDFKNACIIKHKFLEEGDCVACLEPCKGKSINITYNPYHCENDYTSVSFYYPNNVPQKNDLLICPNNFLNLDKYDNIVFLENIANSVIRYLNHLYPDKNIYQGQNMLEFDVKCLDFEKKSFGIVFNFAKNIEISYKDDYTYYKNIFKDCISYAQFVFCYKVLEDIGIFDIAETKDSFSIKITGKSSDLNNCKIYTELKGRL